MIGGIRMLLNGNQNEIIKYKSTQFYNDCGHFARIQKMKYYTKRIETIIQKER